MLNATEVFILALSYIEMKKKTLAYSTCTFQFMNFCFRVSIFKLPKAFVACCKHAMLYLFFNFLDEHVKGSSGQDKARVVSDHTLES